MNKPKATGTKFESSVVRYMQGELQDLRIERRALHGSKDMGDIYGIRAHGYEGIAECKAHKSWTPKMLDEWMQQTLDEMFNADADFALLVVKVPNKNVSQSLVFVTLNVLSMICCGLDYVYEEGPWVCMTLEVACELIRGDNVG